MSRKRIVADKWQIIDEIGSGGQGKIYKVRNISNSTDTNTFALKYLKSQKDMERRKRMYNEVSNIKVL